MILTEFHSITHHSSRITYVGQFDVKVGWTQRSVEETQLFVTSKPQPNKCWVKSRRQRLDPVNHFSTIRSSSLKNDTAGNHTALWKSPSIFQTSRPPLYILLQIKTKIDNELCLNRKSSCTVKPFSILDAGFNDVPRIVREIYKRSLVYYSFLAKKWFVKIFLFGSHSNENPDILNLIPGGF